MRENVIVKKLCHIVIEEKYRRDSSDVMKQADYIIDVGPDGGTAGGEIVFAGTPGEMMESAETITARYLRKSEKM